MIDLSQDELKTIVGILSQVQLSYKDSVVVNQIIFKLDSFIEKPKPMPVQKVPMDHLPPKPTLAQLGGKR
jgi:hypothetical protein